MAAHTVPEGDIGTAAFTLTADTVDTVTFTGHDVSIVEVISDGADEVWYSLGDASNVATPTVGGTDCLYLPAVPCVDERQPPSSGATVVKLISAGTPKIRVQRKGY